MVDESRCICKCLLASEPTDHSIGTFTPSPTSQRRLFSRLVLATACFSSLLVVVSLRRMRSAENRSALVPKNPAFECSLAHSPAKCSPWPPLPRPPFPSRSAEWERSAGGRRAELTTILPTGSFSRLCRNPLVLSPVHSTLPSLAVPTRPLVFPSSSFRPVLPARRCVAGLPPVLTLCTYH